MMQTIYFILFVSILSCTQCVFEKTKARITDYPFQVSVHLDGKHVCGGVIIDESTILTAARCIQGEFYLSQYTVLVGTTIHNEGQEYIVVNVIKHNKLIKNEYDIAILKLINCLNFYSYIKPIQLQEPNEESSVGSICQISKWGKSTYLSAANVSIISNEECSNYYKTPITSKMICARTFNCPRRDLNIPIVFDAESGGPLVCKNKLVGIVSFGKNYLESNDPTMFTNISALRGWISKNNKIQNYCPKRKKHI